MVADVFRHSRYIYVSHFDSTSQPQQQYPTIQNTYAIRWRANQPGMAGYWTIS